MKFGHKNSFPINVITLNIEEYESSKICVFYMHPKMNITSFGEYVNM